MHELCGGGVAGTNGDGQLALIAAIIGLVLLAMSVGIGNVRANRTLTLIVSGAGATLGILVGIGDMTSVAAIGLYLALFGGSAWAVGVIWDIRLGRAAAAARTPDASAAVTPDVAAVVVPPRPPQMRRCPACAEISTRRGRTCPFSG